jgi:hypothetical protein
MPVRNKRAYSPSAAAAATKGKQQKKNNKFKTTAAQRFNMLNVLKGFADVVEWDGNVPATIKVRMLLRNTEEFFDERENSFDRETAVKLLADALLDGKGINLYLFLNDEDGSYSGNGRIDINALVGSSKSKPTRVSKRNYEADIRRQADYDDDGDNESTDSNREENEAEERLPF